MKLYSRYIVVSALTFAHLFWSYNIVEGQVYTDIASDLGLAEISVLSSDNFGSGVSFYDFDQDGWDDLTFTNDSSELRMFRNVAGEFVEVSHNIPPLGVLKEAIWFDYDQDGLMDLLTSSRFSKYKLFKNTGDFSFIDVSEEAGLFQPDEAHYGVAVGDYNRDSFLDFYVCVYALGGDDNDFFANNQLYKNNGDGTFTNQTLETGVGGGIASSFDAGWIDYNSDGWPDLYVVNDREPYSNVMYKNNGDGSFSDVTELTNTAYTGQYPMTVSVCDFDNDADQDIFLTNIGGLTFTELLVNDGNGVFAEKGSLWGIQNNFYSWGALWFDRENDGLRDLYVATSPIGLSQTVYKDIFYRHSADTFEWNESVFIGMEAERSYSLAKGDINNDGYADIVTHTVAPYVPNLWKNSGGTQNFVKLTLNGTASNAQAIGSWIHIYAGGMHYTEFTRCDDNYVSQNSQHLIFGLGLTDVIDSLTVSYPSGHVDRYYSMQVNEHYYLKEGETVSAELVWEGGNSICFGDTVLIDAGNHFSYLWNTGDTSQTLAVSESGNYWVAVQNEHGVTSYSDSLEIIVHVNPVIQYEVQHPTCNGENTGSVFLENAVGVADELVLWNNGSFGPTIDSLYAGLYYYTFIDVNGCEAIGEVFIQEPMLLSVLIFTEPDDGGSNGSISLVINGGTPPYQVSLNGLIQGSELMTDLSAGDYELIVSDDYDCSFEADVEVAIVTGIDKLDNRLFIHPNPISTGHSLKIGGSQLKSLVRLELFDLRGVRIWEHEISETNGKSYETPIITEVSGNYHLRFFFRDDQTISMPLVIAAY